VAVGFGDARLQHPITHLRDVLDARDHAVVAELRHLGVEVAVIEPVDHRVGDDPLQRRHVDEHAIAVRHAAQRDLELVVVAVPVGVVALAEDATVFLVAQLRVVQAVRGAELDRKALLAAGSSLWRRFSEAMMFARRG
jgi:hypothetical protein